MSSNRHSNRNNRNTQRQDEINALNRIATILEHYTNPPPVTSITNNYISVDTLNILNQSETPSEPRTEEPKRKKSRTNKNNAVTKPTLPTNPNYSTQSLPTQTPTNTPQPTQKLYFGVNPLCVNCNFHHPTENPCRLCTKCNRLGHFATNCRAKPLPVNITTQPPPTKKKYTGPYPLCTNCKFHHATKNPCRLCTQCNRLGHYAINCRTNPLPNSSIPQTPKAAITRACYECGDPNHLRHACPKLRITPIPQPDRNRIITLTTAQDQDRPLNQLTATTVPTPQQDQAPEFYNSVMNFII